MRLKCSESRRSFSGSTPVLSRIRPRRWITVALLQRQVSAISRVVSSSMQYSRNTVRVEGGFILEETSSCRTSSKARRAESSSHSFGCDVKFANSSPGEVLRRLKLASGVSRRWFARAKTLEAALASNSLLVASRLSLVGVSRTNFSRKRVINSQITERKFCRSDWMVRMTGTASADHDPICRVLWMCSSADRALRENAWHRVRASLGQLKWSTWISWGLRMMSAQFHGSQEQVAVKESGELTVKS